MKYDLSVIYPHLYRENFGDSKFVNTLSGHIRSDRLVYLNLSDMDLINDLRNVLDFYKLIDTNSFVKFMNYPATCGTLPKHLCITCNMYMCDAEVCREEHKNHKVQEDIEFSNVMYCKKCFLHSIDPMVCVEDDYVCPRCYEEIEGRDDLSRNISYTKPVVENINLYEWVPMRFYLENRNVCSDMYTRKMGVLNINGILSMRLLDKKVDEYRPSERVMIDVIFRVMSKYDVNEYHEKKIIDMCGFKKYRKMFIRTYTPLIIS